MLIASFSKTRWLQSPLPPSRPLKSRLPCRHRSLPLRMRMKRRAARKPFWDTRKKSAPLRPQLFEIPISSSVRKSLIPRLLGAECAHRRERLFCLHPIPAEIFRITSGRRFHAGSRIGPVSSDDRTGGLCELWFSDANGRPGLQRERRGDWTRVIALPNNILQPVFKTYRQEP